MKELLTCRELIADLLAYLDGTMAPDRVEAVDRHLASCRSCTAYLASYRSTIELVRASAGGESPPAPLPEVLARILVATRRGRR